MLIGVIIEEKIITSKEISYENNLRYGNVVSGISKCAESCNDKDDYADT
jgi:hypothetical protein